MTLPALLVLAALVPLAAAGGAPDPDEATPTATPQEDEGELDSDLPELASGPDLGAGLRIGAGGLALGGSGRRLENRQAELAGEIEVDGERLSSSASAYFRPESRFRRNYGGEVEGRMRPAEAHELALAYRLARVEEDPAYIEAYNDLLLGAASAFGGAVRLGLNRNDSYEHGVRVESADRFGSVDSELSLDAAVLHYRIWNGVDTDHLLSSVSHRLGVPLGSAFSLEVRNDLEVLRHSFAGLVATPEATPTLRPLTPTPTSLVVLPGLSESPSPQADYHRYELAVEFTHRKSADTFFRLSGAMTRQKTDGQPIAEYPADNYWEWIASALWSERTDAGLAVVQAGIERRALDAEGAISYGDRPRAGYGFFADYSYLQPTVSFALATDWGGRLTSRAGARASWWRNSRGGEAENYGEQALDASLRLRVGRGFVELGDRLTARRYHWRTREEDFTENRVFAAFDLPWGTGGGVGAELSLTHHRIVGGTAVSGGFVPAFPASLSTSYAAPALTVTCRAPLSARWTAAATLTHLSRAHPAAPAYDQSHTAAKLELRYLLGSN